MRPLRFALFSAALVLAGCSGDGNGRTEVAGKVKERPTTTTAAPTTTTTIAPTTTTTSVGDALRAAFNVRVTDVFVAGPTYDKSLYIAFEVRSLSRQTITAFQFSTELWVTDKLGRTFKRSLLFDCTQSPLAAGETRGAGAVVAGDLPSLQRRVTAIQNCTLGSWDINQFIEEEVGMYRAIAEGGAARVELTPNRVVFANGSAIGTAQTGRL